AFSIFLTFCSFAKIDESQAAFHTPRTKLQQRAASYSTPSFSLFAAKTEREKEEHKVEAGREKSMAPRVGIVATGERLSHLIPLLHSLHIPVSAIWSRNHDECRRLATKHGVPLATRHFQ
ncbi:hypothetical protein GBAR_LOCUS463, partial [Geodia barretti]